jgi:FkbH-like protein
MTQLHWLPEDATWRSRLKTLRTGGATAPQADPQTAWAEAMALANLRIDFVRTNALDETLRALFGATPPKGTGTKPVRLALLGSCTMAHLHGAIRVAGLRRGIWIDIYENDFGQYWQELADPTSGLHAFKPTVVLLALDAHHLAAGLSANFEAADGDAAVEEQLNRIRECWRLAREAFKCPIIHQTAIQMHPELMGNNESRLPGSAARVVTAINQQLRPLAEQDGVDLLAIDGRAARDGLAAWFDVGLWHRAKQEITPAAAPMFGDLVGRILAALQGRSAKCLVLDLDNTLWGGVIGDDGMDGIVLGQGSPLGEGYTAFQNYVRDLSRRGIILAVCSKNDESNAVEPFESHPEMVLKRSDIACFVANWTDKANNIKAIAAELNIGLDSLVFVDDNPVERALIRQELPMVAVPEVTDDPITFLRAVSDAGYFESLAITDEDRARTAQYQGRRAAEALRASATDMDSYLRGLDMVMATRRFDTIGLQRTVQLINKTNQFNLTTRRYTEEDVTGIMQSNRAFGLQLRLIDRFVDNGIIAICIGRMIDEGDNAGEDLLIDTWLMSCRVLGRQVEPTTLNLIAEQAQRLGARRLIGEYLPTKKNGMVKDHYARLGFDVVETREDGSSRAVLDLANFTPAPTFITIKEG